MLENFDFTVDLDPYDNRKFVRRQYRDYMVEFTLWYSYHNGRFYNFSINQLYLYGFEMDDDEAIDYILENLDI